MTTSSDGREYSHEDHPFHAHVWYEANDRVIRADYNGGPFVELTFGRHMYKPIEVIDAHQEKRAEILRGWDELEVEERIPRLRRVLNEWVESMDHPEDEEDRWDDWYKGYRDHNRYAK